MDTTARPRRATALAPIRALCRTLWLAAALALCAAAANPQGSGDDSSDALPERLSDTGLYADASGARMHPDVLAYTPQYTLWSDGADKRRWIRLPRDGVIDASQADAWRFPIGTRLWKEFSHAGHRVETRFIERRRNGTWRYATYLWNAEGTEARLAPARGVELAVAAAPGGRYDVPARGDCTACHEGSATPVLGFSALQLSTARDPQAPHARDPGADDVDLRALVERGLLRHLDPALLREPPRIAATSPTERATLGYLHANCGHCHNRSGNGVPVRLTLAQSALDPEASRRDALASAVAVAGRYRTPTLPGAHLIEPRAPEASVLIARMRSRQPQLQMPPLGTQIADDAGLALVERWIHHLSPTEEKQP